MRQFWHDKKRLVLSLALAFFLTKLLSPLFVAGEVPQLPNISRIAVTASQTIHELRSSLELPELSFDSFVPRFQKAPVDEGQTGRPSVGYFTPELSPTRGVAFRPPTSTPAALIPTNPPGTKSTPTPIPRSNPTPTAIPQPTNPPKPTNSPTPAPVSLAAVRPGKNFRDAANIVGGIMCIPPAMIMATLDNEYGPWMAKAEAEWATRNTYAGSDPYDKPGSSAIPIACPMQMMEDTWSRIKPYVGQKLGTTEISLGVIFDCMSGGAYHLRNVSLAMKDRVTCDDWPVDYILYGACRYNGACPANTFGQKSYYNSYTYSVCEAYNRYTSGPQKKCR